ncbi:MAG TPA: phosphoribosylformylglycinamidine synthase subunit PurL, partial [Allosphingosinicella sp.]|nr:phosphoribosylformylglycinamidine synthase subunit PurL [Allosphingosinicella sp.]
DPFTEKLLIEACLELMASDAIVAIQDMGAAGLTSSSVEMASKGGVGIELDMNAVPCRETGMTPYEMMLSESQERMLMVLQPGREAEAEAIFRKWELDFAVIGRVTDTGHMVLKWNGETAADIPLAPLADEAPSYDRPWTPTEPPPPLADVPECGDVAADLLRLMASPDLASRRWIWEQYDQKVGADTVQPPGGDAALVRVHGTGKALAITTDCTPRYCLADPREGGRQAIAEAYRNLSAVGARPLAATDCMNFGNPQRPEIMGQFVGCIEGMAEACAALDFPIVSGNVSLYNETRGEDGSSQAILPTPAIGGVGLIENWEKAVGIGFQGPGDVIVTIGDRHGHLGQSLWLRELHGIEGREAGPPPPVDLHEEKIAGEFVRAAIRGGAITACHDISDGGLAVAVAEMALAGNVGALINGPAPFGHAGYFAEDQGVYVATVCDNCLLTFLTRAHAAGVPVEAIGRTKGGRLIFELPDGDYAVSLDELRRAHEGFFPQLMGDSLIA